MADEFLDDHDFALGVEDFDSEQEYKLHCLKHSTSHIMAAAVQQIFPEVKFGIGPPIKNGFYYDMDLPRSLNELLCSAEGLFQSCLRQKSG